MPLYSVFTNEYDADIGGLLKRRLAEQKSDDALELSERAALDANSEKTEVSIRIETDAELSAYCFALSELIGIDLRRFEMEKMLERFCFDEEERLRALESALKYSEYCVLPARLEGELKAFFAENSSMNLEGFIRFRLRDRLEVWRAAVDSAVDDMLCEDERSELFELLGVLSLISDEREDVTVVLNPDASCTIMSEASGETADSRRFRIDCAPGNSEGVLHMLLGMKPKRVALIDLSFGACEELKKRIFELFSV